MRYVYCLQNILSWLTAGALAYFWYYVPEQRRQQEQEQAREMARRLAIERGYQNTDVDRRKPVADPQDTGLLRGTKASEKTSWQYSKIPVETYESSKVYDYILFPNTYDFGFRISPVFFLERKH